MVIIALSYEIADAQYSPLRIESREQALRRQIERAKLQRQLEDIQNGRVPTSNYDQPNNNPHITVSTEIHKCSNNGYHNTSYEPHCFDMYFYKDGTVYWDRRRYARCIYNDNLSGTYYLQESGYKRYDLYITWDNGSITKGYVIYNGTHPEFNFDGYAFDAK